MAHGCFYKLGVLLVGVLMGLYHGSISLDTPVGFSEVSQNLVAILIMGCTWK